MIARAPRDAGRTSRAAPGDDAELMRRVATGHVASLGALYDRHHHGVRQFVLRHIASRADAEDVVHDTFLRVARLAADYDGRPSALPYLVGVASRVLRERRRTAARFAAALAAFADAVVRFVHRTPEDAAGTSEEIRAVERAVARLSPEKRIVLLMTERDGLSSEAIAAELGIPVGTVWTRLHHARAEVRRSVAPGRRS